MNLDEFKQLVASNPNFLEIDESSEDCVDFEHGLATIHRINLNKYLEKYACMSEDDLEDTLYYRYGVFAKIID